MNTNGAAQAYHAALETGVLSALENGPRSSQQTAEACGLRERPTALLLEALRAMDVVELSDSKYRLTETTRMLLYSEYRELGNQYWCSLPDFLKTGEPMRKMDDVAKSEEYYQTQAAMLGWMLSPAAEAAASALTAKSTRRDLRILDVGAGSAIWSLSVASRDAVSNVTAVDWPAVLEVAKETAERFGLPERLTTIAGNFHELALPANAFDLVFVANVTHLQTRDQNLSLFGKIHRSLTANGEIVVIDAFPAASEGNVPFALYQLGLALRTENGKVHSAEELQSMLQSQSFEAEAVVPLDVPPFMVGMLVARASK
jgi:ubiquinone/menaquinone biosynthesis C-methylase UbiE